MKRYLLNVGTTTVSGASAVSRSRQQFSSKHPDMSCCPSNVTFSLRWLVCLCPICPPFPIFPTLFLSFSIPRCVLLLIWCKFIWSFREKHFQFQFCFFPTSTIVDASKVIQANLGHSQVHTHSHPSGSLSFFLAAKGWQDEPYLGKCTMRQAPARVGLGSSRSEKWKIKAFTLLREVQSEK